MADEEQNDQPRELGLDNLTALLGVGPDMTLQILGIVIDGIGTGMEWTGEQLDRLGELTQELGEKVTRLRNNQEG